LNTIVLPRALSVIPSPGSKKIPSSIVPPIVLCH
jgi:hypothetical protein